MTARAFGVLLPLSWAVAGFGVAGALVLAWWPDKLLLACLAGFGGAGLGLAFGRAEARREGARWPEGGQG